MENSIEKDEEILNNIKTYMQENIDKGYHKFVYNDLGYDEKCIDIINAIETVLSELKKKDKIIDLMAEELVKAHEWFYSEFDNYTKEDFIKYFEKKTEE